jgi:pilus assembly protein CpaF
MVMMANGNLPLFSIRHQIAAALNLIVQVERLRDGSRKITHITEIVGTEGDIIITQDLFHFAYNTAAQRDDVAGAHESTGMRPAFTDRARYFGMEAALIEAMRP